MKTPYSFSVLRYIHDIVTGEFINVGVVLNRSYNQRLSQHLQYSTRGAYNSDCEYTPRQGCCFE